MTSKEEIRTTLDAIEAGQNRLLGMPLHTLTWAERMSLLQQIDQLGRKLVIFDRRLLGRLIAQAPPPQFGGASWPDVLSRRLRISRAEAERCVAAAVYSPDVDRPSA